ncbi:hypothetical protein PTKIN_Ptkin01aG0128600 [Pterospermum kingtungense]
MVKELIGMWRLLRLTEDEKDNIERADLQNNHDVSGERSWLVTKLFTNRPFNREALLNTESWHEKLRCDLTGDRSDDSRVKQYGDWLRAFSGVKGNMTNVNVGGSNRRRAGNVQQQLQIEARGK